MRTVADHQVLEDLIRRLSQLRPDTQARWGTFTAGEVLCHLADAHESVLGVRVPPGPAVTGNPNPLIKWVALYSPLPWPKGARTRPGVNPKLDGTRPGDFEPDRERAIGSLRRLAETHSGLAPAHFMFGPMAPRDWHRWAYRHNSHHLRQFGL